MSNPTHFFFKRGWIFFGVLFLMVLGSVFVSFGPDPVILQWAGRAVMEPWQKGLLFLSGLNLIVILGFRLSERS